MLVVTGSTGHTGRFFLKELAEGQYADRVRCMVRSSEKADAVCRILPNAETVTGSLDSEQDIQRLLTDADTVVHIANIRYSPDIIRIGRMCGVKRFVLVHTTGMYSKYKAASQGYIEIENQINPFMEELNITVVRPTMIFGDMCDHNVSKFIRFVDRFPVLPIVAGGNSLIQPVNARDLAKGIMQALKTEKSKGKAYILSGEKPVTVRQLYQMIGSLLGKKKLIIGIPMWMCVMGGVALKFFSLGRIDIVEKIQRMGENRAYSHDAATADLGYVPEAFDLGLCREVEEYIALTKHKSS